MNLKFNSIKKENFAFSVILIIFSLFLIGNLIFTIPQVKADFFLNTNLTTNTVCPSSTIILATAVSTTEAGAFTITQAGSASNFATTVPTGLYLEAYQTDIVYTYLTPSTRVSPGLYTLEIKVEGNGKIKTSTQTIVVENCHNTNLIVEPKEQTICACENNLIKLTLFNNGKYLENYNLGADGIAASWLNLSSTALTLQGNSSQDVYAYISTPCNVLGKYEVNFVAKSESEYSQTNAKSSLNVVFCYDYSIIPEKYYYPICENEKISIPVTITNKGVRTNNYKINLYSADWITADQKELSVEKNSSKIFNILAQPAFKTLGNYTATIEVLSNEGKVIKKQEILFESKNCYNVLTDIQESKDRMCNALSKSYSVLIKNTGSFKNIYDITIDGPAWATISEKRLTLNASEEKLLTLELNPPYEVKPETYEIKVTAIDKISNYSYSDTITLSTISVEDCYKPQISSQNNEIEIAKDNTGTVVFVIENKGINEAEYSLELSGTATQFAELNPGTVIIKPAKAQTVYLYLSPSPEVMLGNYSLTVSARLKDTTIVSTKTINVIVTKEVGQKITNETNVTQTEVVVQKSIFQKIAEWFSSIFAKNENKNNNDITTNVIEANTTDTINITNATNITNTTNLTSNIQEEILIENKTEDNNSEDNKTEIIEEINVTNETVVIEETPVEEETSTEEQVIQPTPEIKQTAPILENQIPNVNIKKNDKITFDLSYFFEDPNELKLTFVTIKPANVDIVINSTQATVIPKTDYTGMVQMTFYASNGKEITPSNKFNITISDKATTVLSYEEDSKEITIDKASFSAKTFWNQYKYYLILSIFVIIVLALILSGAAKKAINFFQEDDEEKED